MAEKTSKKENCFPKKVGGHVPPSPIELLALVHIYCGFSLKNLEDIFDILVNIIRYP